MAALFFNTRQMELNVALASIGELKNVIANEFKQSGFTDVVDTQSEVAGNRNGVRLSVVHLHISSRSFFEIVMAAGDSGDVTLGTVNEITTKNTVIDVPLIRR